jgi:hypothetical protein
MSDVDEVALLRREASQRVYECLAGLVEMLDSWDNIPPQLTAPAKEAIKTYEEFHRKAQRIRTIHQITEATGGSGQS